MINNNGIDVSVNSEMMDNEENSEIVDTKCKPGRPRGMTCAVMKGKNIYDEKQIRHQFVSSRN